MRDSERDAVALFVFKVSMEGLAGAMEDYPPGEDAPRDLREAVENGDLWKTESLLEKYMEKYDLEYS